MHRIAQDTAPSETRAQLVLSISNGLLALNNGNVENLVFKVISSFALTVPSDNQWFQQQDIDIFTPILNTNTLSQEVKLDLVAILMAYCSIFPTLHPLITNSLPNWSPYLQTTKKENVGIYSVISLVEQFNTFNIQTLQFFQFNLASSLINHWIPFWLNYNSCGNDLSQYLQNDTLSVLCTNESWLDLYIATTRTQTNNETFAFFNKIIAKRTCLFQKWIPEQTYNIALNQVIKPQIQQSTGFQLQILMEVIDHPEFAFSQEPRLVTLLFIALNDLKLTPVSIIHKHLASLNSTQTYVAMINMVQFILTQNLLELTNSKTPDWFSKTILPSIPPISKSLFIFDDSSEEQPHFTSTLELLFQCLISTILINNETLQQYKKLNINPLFLNENKELDHILTENYMQLYNISTISSLILAEQLNTNDKWSFYSSDSHRQLISKLIFSHSTKIFENLTILHGNITIYHLIKFLTKISQQDLSLQTLSVDLLNHLFFHNISNNSILVKDLCLQNKLSKQSLTDYISLWNDGTQRYSLFYKEILKQDQPMVPMKQTNILELLKFLPKEEYESIIINEKLNVDNFANNEIQQPIQPYPQKNMKLYISSNNKYNAYSSSSFVPNNNNTNNYPPQTGNNYMFNTPMSTPNISTYDAINTESNTNPLLSTMQQADTFSAFSTPFTLPSSNGMNNQSDMVNSTPKTPSISSSMNTGNPWGGSPSFNSTNNASSSKMVNTGKNYILGGHNRIKNNSRAQSIHIDQFENNQ